MITHLKIAFYHFCLSTGYKTILLRLLLGHFSDFCCIIFSLFLSRFGTFAEPFWNFCWALWSTFSRVLPIGFVGANKRLVRTRCPEFFSVRFRQMSVPLLPLQKIVPAVNA